MSRYRDLDLLHPIARRRFAALAADLAKDTDFLPFESYRDPADQRAAVARGASRAAPWLSAHQYGLAVDFVPFINGEWKWPDASHQCWDVLRLRAERHGLRNTIAWDRPHVEHPAWERVRAALSA